LLIYLCGIVFGIVGVIALNLGAIALIKGDIASALFFFAGSVGCFRFGEQMVAAAGKNGDSTE